MATRIKLADVLDRLAPDERAVAMQLASHHPKSIEKPVKAFVAALERESKVLRLQADLTLTIAKRIQKASEDL